MNFSLFCFFLLTPKKKHALQCRANNVNCISFDGENEQQLRGALM